MNSLMPALNPSGLDSDGVAKSSSLKTSTVDENKPSFKETMDKQPRSRADRAGSDGDVRKVENNTEPAKSKASEGAENKPGQSQDHSKKVAQKDGDVDGGKGRDSLEGARGNDTDASAPGHVSYDTDPNENISAVGDEGLLEGASLLGVSLETADVSDTGGLSDSALVSASDSAIAQGSLVVDQVLVTDGVLDNTSNSALEALVPLQAFKVLREHAGTFSQAAVVAADEGVLGGGGKSLGMPASTVISNASSTQPAKSVDLLSTGNETGSLTGLALKDSLHSKVPLGLKSNERVGSEGSTLLNASGNNTLTTPGMSYTATLLKGGNSESLFSSEMLTRLGDQLDVGTKPVSGAQPLHASLSPSVMSGIPSGADVRVQMPVSIAFGESGWGNMIAERSALMASQSLKFAELQLDPPELGQLQVKVTVNQDQASVSFVAANAQVKDALDQSLVRLKELLEEQGLDLVNVDVSDQSSEESESDLEGEEEGQLAVDSDMDEGDGLSESSQVTATYGVDHYA